MFLFRNPATFLLLKISFDFPFHYYQRLSAKRGSNRLCCLIFPLRQLMSVISENSFLNFFWPNKNVYVLLDCDGVMETEFLLPPGDSVAINNGVSNGEGHFLDNDGDINSTSPSIDDGVTEDLDLGKYSDVTSLLFFFHVPKYPLSFHLWAIGKF